ncbi:hypothetical protein AX16_009974 [Volvariella volvacea WC 439]|nr:hypothetical protein AX16_009974 [Volvariella volvacea WC 439]
MVDADDTKLLDGLPRPVYQATHPPPPPPPRCRRLRRVAVGLAVLALLALGHVAFRHFRRRHFAPVRHSEIPDDVTVVECAPWEQENGWGVVSYKLPVDSAKLFFYSQGPLPHGSINFMPSEPGQDDDNVHFKIHISKRQPDPERDAKICRLQGPQPDQNGIGILVDHPHHDRRRDWLFTVFVTIPASTGLKPTVIEEFETDLAFFSHFMGDMTGGIKFNKLTLRSANQPVQALFVNGGSITFETVNEIVSGAFNASKSLTLKTLNGPVEAVVNLGNADESIPSVLDISTSHGHVKTSMNLISEHAVGGAFDVDIRTSSGSLDVRIPSAPLNHKLNLKAETSYSPIRANIHNFYEGSLKGQSSWAHTNLIWDPLARHPDGEERKRAGVMRESRSWRSPSFEGAIWWAPGEEGKERGSFELTTTFGNIDLGLSERVLF